MKITNHGKLKITQINVKTKGLFPDVTVGKRINFTMQNKI